MSNNLIVNPSFEGEFAPWQGFGTVMVAPGWTPWWKPAATGDPAWMLATPEFKEAKAPFENRVRSGKAAQQWFTADKTHSAGIFQRVPAPAGALVKASAWMHVWSTKGNDPTSGSPENGRENGHLEVRIGLDLAGNTNPWSPDVVWSDWLACYDFWRKIELAGVVQAGYVTLFIQSECMYPVNHNDVYVDDVALVVDGAPVQPPISDDVVTWPVLAALLRQAAQIIEDELG